MWTYLRRSLLHHALAHTSVVLAAALACAIVSAVALVDGSLKAALYNTAVARAGGVHAVLHTADRHFPQDLARRFDQSASLPADRLDPGLILPASLATTDPPQALPVQLLAMQSVADAGSQAGSPVALANQAIVRGFGPRPNPPDTAGPNRPAELTITRPDAMPADAPLASDAPDIRRLALQMRPAPADTPLASLSLQATGPDSLNLLLPHGVLANALSMPERANTLLLQIDPQGRDQPLSELDEALQRAIRMADLQLDVQASAAGHRQISTSRVLIDAPIAAAAARALPEAQQFLTWFAVDVMHAGRSAHYAVLTALSHQPVGQTPILTPKVPGNVILNEVLARNIQAVPGDRIQITWWHFGAARRLELRSTELTVEAVVPLEGAAADAELLPAFPGMYDARGRLIRDPAQWEASFPLDREKARNAESYWDRHGPIPQMFLHLDHARELFATRYGDTTLIRLPPDADPAQAEGALLKALNLADIGLRWQLLQQPAVAAAKPANDFAALFAGLAGLLILAALLLAAMVYGFSTQRRAAEHALLMAIGHTPAAIRRCLLAEAAILAAIALCIGLPAGVLMAVTLLHLLAGPWAGAVAGVQAELQVSPLRLGLAALLAMMVCLLVIPLQVRRLRQASLSAHLANRDLPEPTASLSRPGLIRRAAIALPPVALLLLVYATTQTRSPVMASALALGAGAIMLAGMVWALRWALHRMIDRPTEAFTRLSALALRQLARSPSRTVTAAGLLGTGIFITIAIGANRIDPLQDADKPTGGTGGFDVQITFARPIDRDLADPHIRQQLALPPTLAAESVRVAMVRRAPGDDASCISLGSAQQPALLGVQPADLHGRFRFAAVEKSLTASPDHDPWSALKAVLPDEQIPAIADQNTLLWGLGKGLGDTLTVTDHAGRPRTLRIVAMLDRSALQGVLIVHEQRLLELHPAIAGHAIAWLDLPEPPDPAAINTSAGLLAFAPSTSRMTDLLAGFVRVEQTYLQIFLAFSALAVLIGACGLAILLFRSLTERRAEWAVLQAIGHPRRTLRQLIARETACLAAAGLCIGLLPATLAIVPAILTSPGMLPWNELAGFTAGLLGVGVGLSLLSAGAVVRLDPLASLRRE